MKSITAALLIVISFLALFAVGWAASPLRTSSKDTGKISGKVFRSDINTSYSGVDIVLSRAEENIPESERITRKVKTDRNGDYCFAEIKPGEYRLSVTVKFKSQSSLPCPPPTPPFLVRNSDGWPIEMERSEDGRMIETVWDKFSVSAGDDLTKDIDLNCK